MVFIPSFLPHKAGKSIHRFVSLGENCEFGFVQRKLRYNKGGLLKWAFTRHEPLIKLLEENFEGLYDFKNLDAHEFGMLEDRHFGVLFHTKMKLEGRTFLQSEKDRRAIHEVEMGKIAYLVNRLRTDLADPQKIFVYKANGGTEEAFVGRLRSAMDRYGKAKLLVVRDGGEPRVNKVNDRLLMGSISRFADYATAHKAQYKEWFEVVERAAEL